MPIVTVNDAELNVFDQGQGPPILFVHGFPLNHTMWQAQLDAFAGSHRVIAPDLRGFGASGVSQATLSMERFADDLDALLNALGVDEPITYCGLSMGGYVAWEFIRKYGSRLKALVLCDTRAAADSPEAVDNRRKMAQLVLENGVEPIAKAMTPKLLSQATLDSQPDVGRRLSEMILSTRPETVAAALHAMAERADATEKLGSIGVPTLMVVGSEDILSTVDEMRGMSEAVPGANLVVIDGAGHMSPMEDPQAVNAALASFLESVSR